MPDTVLIDLLIFSHFKWTMMHPLLLSVSLGRALVELPHFSDIEMSRCLQCSEFLLVITNCRKLLLAVERIWNREPFPPPLLQIFQQFSRPIIVRQILSPDSQYRYVRLKWFLSSCYWKETSILLFASTERTDNHEYERKVAITFT